MRRFLLIYGLVGILICGGLGLAGCGDQPGTIEGTVTDAASQEVVGQAQVVVFALERTKDFGDLDVYSKGIVLREDLTDGNGHYAYTLAPGTYVIQVWAEGLEVADRMVEVKSGRTVTLDFSVEIPSP